ncbi:Rna pseudouridine synthase 6 protein, partial [Thalictrum thalictroides]
VVLARTKEYCSVFHGKMREKIVKKLYRALAAAPVPRGIMSHYMRPVNVAPRLVSEDFHRGWHLCQLEVLECTEVPWPNAAIQEKYFVDDCGWPSKDIAYELLMTHGVEENIVYHTDKSYHEMQIRAQFAACGAPIVGDSMYIPAVMAERSNPGVNPFGEHGKLHATEEEKANAEKEWMAQHGKEPSVAIGLQAYQISWDEGEYIYEAGSPWWR